MGIATSKDEEAQRESRVRAEQAERRQWDQLERELDLDIELDLGTYGGGGGARWEGASRRVTPPRATEHFPSSKSAARAEQPKAASMSVGAPGSTGASALRAGGSRRLHGGQKAERWKLKGKRRSSRWFRWEHGGHDVYITGTFNKWREKILMHRSGNDFTYVHGLKQGKHAYKFIVDDEWRFAPDQPTIADQHGNINNYIDLTQFEKKFTVDHSNKLEFLAHKSKVDVCREDIFSRQIPNLEGYTKRTAAPSSSLEANYFKLRCERRFLPHSTLLLIISTAAL